MQFWPVSPRCMYSASTTPSNKQENINCRPRPLCGPRPACKPSGTYRLRSSPPSGPWPTSGPPRGAHRQVTSRPCRGSGLEPKRRLRQVKRGRACVVLLNAAATSLCRRTTHTLGGPIGSSADGPSRRGRAPPARHVGASPCVTGPHGELHQRAQWPRPHGTAS